ncbi:MAG: FAD-dependent monooxygenase [Burkholderiales bacterium]|nr:FAD-dependent monooxygenase [Burkholderiales bacterium]
MTRLTPPSHVDVLIAGGGPVGGALALMLGGSGLSVAVAEARPAPAQDARALALAYASRTTLDALDVWPGAAATAIHTVHVSQQHGFGRVKLDRADLALPALGYVMHYSALATRIHQRLLQGNTRALGIDYLPGAQVSRLSHLDGYAAAELTTEGASALITAGMVVLADGGRLLGEAGINQRSTSYDQVALVAELVADRPHHAVAFERFAEDGPIALLPIADRADQAPGTGRYAMVWTRPAQDPLSAASLDDAAFLAALQARVGDRAGLFCAIGPRTGFPLALRWAEAHHARRVAVVGNAAQTLHPVAGQGFNLGLRDAQALARVIRASALRDIGSAAMLARYEASRKRDSLTTIGFTDGLIRLFRCESAPIRHARALGLTAFGQIDPLRRGFAQRMVFGTQ